MQAATYREAAGEGYPLKLMLLKENNIFEI